MILDKYTIIFVSSFYIIVGYFGNIVTIIIFRQKEFQKQSISVYFICASIINLVLITYLPWTLVPNLWTISSIACKIFFEIQISVIEIQSWILAIFSFDRLIMVMVPYKLLFRKKLKFQLATVIIISIILIVAFFPYLYFYDIEQNSQNITMCLLSPASPSWVWFYGKLNYTLLRAIIPFSIMIISSILIFWKVFNNKRKLRGVDASFQKEYQMAICLILVDIFFLLARLPNSVYSLLYKQEDGSIIYTKFCAIFSIIGTGHSVFEFIIFICFNKVYRNLFLSCILCCRRSRSVAVYPK